MLYARLILLMLLCASPVVAIFDGPVMHGVIAAFAAIGLAIVGRMMRPVEMQFFISTAGRAVLIATIPALWMLFQLLPIRAFAHPIWMSAEAAIGQSLTGAISIDIGAGVLAIGQYLSIVAIGFWSAAVAVDRQRAESILLALVIGTTLCALTVPVGMIFGVLDSQAAQSTQMQGLDCAAIGVVIALAALLRAFERHETGHANPGRSLTSLLRSFAASAAALCICAGVLIFAAPHGAMIAAGYGTAIFAGVVGIRRVGLGPWGIAAVAVPIGLSFLLLVLSSSSLGTTSTTLAFAPQSQARAISIGQRILDDTPLAGTGAATYAALIPIYRDAADRTDYATAPTAAAAIAVELGKPALWLIVAASVGAIAWLLRCALGRGRDSFYALAGACTIATMAAAGFTNAGILGTAAAALAASSVGLAFAQSKSRTVRT